MKAVTSRDTKFPKAESGRGVRRCDLCEHQQGDLAVEPAHRGEGTKIIADGSSASRSSRKPLWLPLVTVFVSPHLSTAVSLAHCHLEECVLARSLLDQLPAQLIGASARCSAHDTTALSDVASHDPGDGGRAVAEANAKGCVQTRAK